MNRGQRIWSAISLIVVAVFLAIFFLEFSTYTTAYEFGDRLLIPFHESLEPLDCTNDTLPSAFCKNGKANMVVVQGLYVRHGRSTGAGLIFGGLLPITLFFGAGFIALSGKRRD